jgi:hypothetical protein
VIATFRIFARKIEKVDTGEDGKEATKEGNGVDGVARVEALEEDEGGDESAGGESDIVQGVDTRWVSGSSWEKAMRRAYMLVLN